MTDERKICETCRHWTAFTSYMKSEDCDAFDLVAGHCELYEGRGYFGDSKRVQDYHNRHNIITDEDIERFEEKLFGDSPTCSGDSCGCWEDKSEEGGE